LWQYELCVGMRQFNDRDGRWRVWLVQPGTAAARASGEIAEGWLCFESLETERRHRLMARNVPQGWDEGSDIILRQLLAKAKKASDGAVMTKTVAKQRRDLEDQARAASSSP
jgi:hypothetical protein